jgi:S1-C subfamily serine protease
MVITHKIKHIFVALLVITLLLGASACSLPQIFTPPQSHNSNELTQPGWTFPSAGNQTTPLPQFADVVAKVKPAVVSITTERIYHNWWGEEYSKQSAGSGVIIDPEGYIVTNNHVVEDANKTEVKLYDGRTLPASVVGADPQRDLAVIKVNTTNLPYAELGNSSELRQGDWVLALGNALGMGRITVVKGIVSALDVTITISSTRNTLHNLILIDAPINPGNSGGPLVNMAGEVVGINCAKIVEVSVEGMGYAISIDSAKPIIEKLIQGEQVLHPWLGVSIRSSDEGALIVEVVPDSPAEAAGLKAGDIIIEFEGEEINTAEALWQTIQNCEVGQEVEITYIRDGKPATTWAVLEQLPS